MAPWWAGNNYAGARELRRHMTRAEQLAWEELRGRRLNGLKFHRQRPWGTFVLDFYCPSLRLAIEIDGPIHADPEKQRLDAERQHVLENAGIRFARVSAEDVEAAPLATLKAAVTRFVHSQDPTPPLRDGGEGGGG
jgi:very-short-patch-repair endonuclease